VATEKTIGNSLHAQLASLLAQNPHMLIQPSVKIIQNGATVTDGCLQQVNLRKNASNHENTDQHSHQKYTLSISDVTFSET
jgi:hypothetical protein